MPVQIPSKKSLIGKPLSLCASQPMHMEKTHVSLKPHPHHPSWRAFPSPLMPAAPAALGGLAPSGADRTRSSRRSRRTAAPGRRSSRPANAMSDGTIYSLLRAAYSQTKILAAVVPTTRAGIVAMLEHVDDCESDKVGAWDDAPDGFHAAVRANVCTAVKARSTAA
jgi:hypothetical protein